MPTLTIDLTDEIQARLKRLAEAQGVGEPEYVRAILGRALTNPGSPSVADPPEASSSPLDRPATKPIWRRAVDAGLALPAEERARIPRDGSANVDHYVYGAPKAS